MTALYIILSYIAVFFFFKFTKKHRLLQDFDNIAVGAIVIFAPITLPYIVMITSVYLIVNCSEKVGRFVTRD